MKRIASLLGITSLMLFSTKSYAVQDTAMAADTLVRTDTTAADTNATAEYLSTDSYATPGYFDTLSIPKKWKNESVVILKYEYSYNFTVSYYAAPSKSEKVKVSYWVRDKWGVEELSQINLPSELSGSEWENNVIGTVYKTDGTKHPITKDQLIPRKEKIDFNASNRGRRLSIESDVNQKLAVPSLEVGDILEIDYSISTSYPPPFILLINKFPMLRFESSVTISQPSGPNQIYLTRQYKNTTTTTGDVSDVHIRIVLDSVDKFKDEILYENYKRIPYVLLRYNVSRNNLTYNRVADHSDTPFNDKYSAEELHLFLARKIYLKGSGEEKRISKTIMSLLAKKHPVITDTLAYIKDAYYLYREIIAREDIYSGISIFRYRSDRFFTCVMSRILFEKKVPHKIFLTQPDHYGTAERFNELIETEFGVQVTGKKLFLFNPLNAYDPENIPPNYEGQSYYSFSANKYYKKYKYFAYFWIFPPAGLVTLPITLPVYIAQSSAANKNRKFDLRPDTFPSDSADFNRIVYDIEVKKINTEDHTVSFVQKGHFWGKHKLSEAEKVCSISKQYLLEGNPYLKLTAEPSSARKPVKPDVLTSSKKRLDKLVKSELYRDGFSVKKLDDYSVLETNFFDASRPFTHSISFSANNLAWSFNNYIILNAGNFIGSQLTVPEKSQDRQQDFYIPYRKQYQFNITIPIPEGYSPENLSEFNMSKVTKAGYFISEAKIENNKVLIKTRKCYAFRKYLRDSASDVYDFLYEAEKFYNKKLIFKKI